MFSRQSTLILVVLLISWCSFATGELPLANLASGRQFEASSTCGLTGVEEYCYTESNGVLLPVDDCFVCAASSPLYSRGIDNINDDDSLGSENYSNLTQTEASNSTGQTWWQSATGENDVTIELTFERGFDLFQITVDFRSLRPASGSLHMSTDFGASYTPIQYYSDKCLEDFGVPDDDADTSDSNGGVGCTSNYTTPSPGTLVYDAYSSPLTAATNVQLRLLRINTPPPGVDFGDELQHYAIYDFEVLGTCSCTQTGLVCVCEEEVPVITTPPQVACDLPGVTGPTCETCLTGYYNYSQSTGCQPCNCSTEGTLDSICNAETGQCDCAEGVLGPTCASCPSGSIGPSRFTETRCTGCFCNGFSVTCESAEGWYQAKVESDLFDHEGFKSNGVIKNDSSAFLEVTPSTVSPNSVIISFPKDYLGDKRTAYNQRLSMTVSLPHLNKSESESLTACLEVVGRTDRYPQVRIIWPLKTDDLGTEPQLIEVPLVSGEADLVPYFTRYRGRLAKTKQIREVLTNIRMMRLVVSTKPKIDSDPLHLTVRLHSSSLPFAVNDLNNSFALQPYQQVSYVELCTQCPSTRTGDHCGQCTEGLTIDPSNGGEFSVCVECFCNFFSDVCHPMSGVCSNCTANTFGADCEICLPGYARLMPLTLLPCDQCADGYWDSAGNGTCSPCSCNLAGSISNICDQSTGVCECREGVVGDLCDSCANNTSQIFPSCEPCDECTDQWSRKIDSLGDQLRDTTEFISSVNLTNTTLDIPLLNTLFELAGDIESLLSNSSIDLLTTDVESFNARLCRLINQTGDLIERGDIVQAELDRIGTDTRELSLNLPTLMSSLAVLRADIENVSTIFKSQDFISVNSSLYTELARRALDRSDSADQLVQGNVSSILNETVSILETFNATIEENQVIEINRQLQEAAANLNSTVSQMQAFVSAATQRICGTGNDVCFECSNETCETCPSGLRCDGLIATADLASNISGRAVVIAEDLLEQIVAEVQVVEELLERARGVKRGAEEVFDFVSEINTTSQEFVENVFSLIAELERELNTTRVDPQDIFRLNNETLSFELDLLPEEFFDLLVEINSTIDAFFGGSGVNEVELRERLVAAQRRAEKAKDLAAELASNATALREQLAELTAEQNQVEASVNQTNSLVEGAENALRQAETLLENTESSLNRSRDILFNISDRLVALDLQIDQNILDVGVAQNFTRIAQERAGQLANDSVDVEREFVELRDEALVKLEQSEQDLNAALDIRNRTMAVLQLTQRQLLDVENFERTKNALILEQELTQIEVRRVALELEDLETEIQKHIARNTACLDGPVLSKRKRKRRSPRLKRSKGH